MKVLFAVHDEKISSSIVKKYQKEYKEIISYKNVYYYNAILKELQRDKTYNRIIIDEDLEEFTSSSFEQKDKFIFEKLDNITDEATDSNSNDIPIVLICSERRTKSEEFLIKLFGIGIYNAIVGNDRSTDEVCRLIKKPRSKKEAKLYYRIDSEDSTYRPEKADDVSEEEMQNILSYFKKLGKNEQKYVDGFKNLVSQYNEKQLKIIIAILPQNVKMILDENSPEYQKLVASTKKRSINNYDRQKKLEGTSEKLLLDKKRNASKPIVVPTKLEKTLVKQIEPKNRLIIKNNIDDDDFDLEKDLNELENKIVKKGSKKIVDDNNLLDENTEKQNVVKNVSSKNAVQKTVKKTSSNKIKSVELEELEKINDEKVISNDESKNVSEPVKKKRGRPRKNPVSEEIVKSEAKVETEEKIKSNLVSDDKNLETKNNEFEMLDDFDGNIEVKSQNNKTDLDELEDIDDDNLSDFDEDFFNDDGFFDDDLPELNDLEKDDEEIEDEEDNQLPGVEDEYEEEESNLPEDEEYEENEEDNQLPGFEDEYEDDEEDNQLPGFEEDEYDDYEENQSSEFEDEGQATNLKYDINNYRKSELKNEKTMSRYEDYDYDYTEYNSLLSSTKKVMTFVGTSKNGTSFIVNNIAKVLADSGIDTAILDATQNKNAYYIYTKNEEDLRQQAIGSVMSLINGEPQGIKVKNNLTVYTEPPSNGENLSNVGPILENLVKKHSAVLIDCDFNTPFEYFNNAQEIYLIQSMDVLTIQPFTAFLRELKSKDILDERKIKVIINKAVKIKGITSKIIVGGMAYYNDPEMSFMTELFDRNSIVPIDIPFDTIVYQQYLEGLIDCEITIDKYPKEFIKILKDLACVVYPLLPAKRTKEKSKKGYQYSATTSYSNNGFSDSVNNTLNNMKNKY